MEMFDLIIVGAGTAGLTAAATAGVEGLQVCVVEQLAPGGQIATVDRIRNFPGFPEGIGGYELGPLLQQQALDAGVAFRLDTVEQIAVESDSFVVRCSEGALGARAVLLAMGSSRRTLDVPGEGAFEGRGVSHCAACDGHFFRGKTVIVAGGGDSAFDEAEILAGLAEAVVIVHDSPAPVAQRQTVERVSTLPNVRIMARARITSIEGGQEVERVTIETADGAVVEAASGVFVYVGLDPNSRMVEDLVTLDARGAIVADADFQTDVPGLFVAGDLRSGARALLASTTGDGAFAASRAIRFLREKAPVAELSA